MTAAHGGGPLVSAGECTRRQVTHCFFERVVPGIGGEMLMWEFLARQIVAKSFRPQ